MKKTMKTAYGEPTPAFHHKVMNTLYHLDDTATSRSRHVHTKRLVVFGVAAAIVGTTAVAAAATNLFGLIHEPVGQYGISVTAGNSMTEEEPQRNSDYDIVTAYLPEGYTILGDHGNFTICSEGGRFGHGASLFALIYDANTYHQTERNVVSTEEKTFNGHQVVITAKKVSEQTEAVYYVVTEKFEEENIVVRLETERLTDASFSYDELIRILEGLSVTPASAKAPEIGTPVVHKTPISHYDLDEVLSEGRTTAVTVNKDYTAVVAGDDGVEKNITIKVSSITEQDNAVGLEKDDFDNAGPLINLHDKYFDSNDQLMSSYTLTVTDALGDGINSLAQTHEKTIQRHFYVANVEITAQEAIDDIYSVLSVYGYGMNDSGKRFYDSDDGEVNLIYSSGYYTQPQVSVKAGETVTLKVGIIADDGVKENAVMTIMTVNGKAETAATAIVPLV